MKFNNIKAEITKKIVFVYLFSFLVSVVFTAGLDKYAWRRDLVSFITGARIIVGGDGENIYNLDFQSEYQSKITTPNKLILLPFRNPPITAFFFIPLSFLSINNAYKIYVSILISVLVFISWLSLKTFENLNNSYWFVLPFIFNPSIVAIFSGQISVFLLLIFMFIFINLKKTNSFKTGLLTGFLLIKLQYLVIFPFVYFLIKDKKQFFFGFFISSLFVLIGSIYISGIGFFEEYLRMLILTENPLYGTKNTSMFSLFSSLSQIISTTKQNLLLLNLGLYLIVIWIFYTKHRRLSLGINFTILTLLTLVFCIHGGDVDLVLLLLPIWLLIDAIRSSKKIEFEKAFVIFILIFSTLAFVLKISFIIPFLFLLSVALLFRRPDLQIQRK